MVMVGWSRRLSKSSFSPAITVDGLRTIRRNSSAKSMKSQLPQSRRCNHDRTATPQRRAVMTMTIRERETLQGFVDRGHASGSLHAVVAVLASVALKQEQIRMAQAQ